MRIFKFLSFALVVMVFVGCTQSKHITDVNNLQREWMLKTLPGTTYGELVKARAAVNLSNLQQSRAFGGCNRMFFTTKTSGSNGISFSNIGATKMYCEETMHIEDALIKALSAVSKYEVSGHQISFKDANNKVLMTAVAADWD